MPLVTAVSPLARAPDRYRIAVDGVEIAVVAGDALGPSGRVGVTVEDETVAAWRAEGEVLQAFDRALSLIAFRPRTEQELGQRLAQKGFAPAVVTRTVARLVGAGWLNDTTFAQQFARSKLIAGGQGARRVEAELLRRGVTRTIATTAVRTVTADEGLDEGATLERLVQKKLRTLEGVEPSKARQRLFGFLARRGFALSEVQAVLRRLDVDLPPIRLR